MMKLAFILFVMSLLVLSGCRESVTGKSISEPEKKIEIIDGKIEECAKACNDGAKPEEYYLNSCSKILQYGGEKVFDAYVEACRKA